MSSPKVGEYLDGYYFSGGDPSKKENWMAPPEVGSVQDGYEYVGGFPGDKNNWRPAGQSTGLEDTGKGLMAGFAKSASLNYAPEIYAGIKTGAKKIGELAGGEAVPEDYFSQQAGSYKEFEKGALEKAPIAGTIGQIGGFLAPGAAAGKVAAGAIKGAGAIAGLGRGVAEGAALGAAYKPEEGETRLGNLASGAAGGAVGTALGGAVKKGGASLKDLSETMRVTGAGAMLRETRNFLDRGQIGELASFIKKNKLVGVGSTVGSVAKKAETIVQKTGQELDKLYTVAKQKFDDAEFISKLTPKQQDEYLDAGFFPASQRDEIMSFVEKNMGDLVDKRGGITAAKNYLEDLITKYGDDVDIKTARNIKSEIDKAINYARNPQTRDPAKEVALYQFRTFINDKINKQVDFLSQALGTKDGAKLRELNKTYGYARTVADMAEDKLAREMANRSYGLSEQIATTGAGAAGLGAYAIGNQDQISQDPIGAIGSGLLYGGGLAGLGFLGSRGLRAYGQGIGASALDAAGKALNKTGGAIKSVGPGVGLLRD